MVKKISGRPPSMVGSVVTGAALALAWTLAGTALLAKLLNSEILEMEKIGYGAMAVILSAVYVGAAMAQRKAYGQTILAPILAGAAYYMCLILVNALFFGGSYTGLGITLVLVSLSVGISLLAAGKGSAWKKRKTYKIPKI